MMTNRQNEIDKQRAITKAISEYAKDCGIDPEDLYRFKANEEIGQIIDRISKEFEGVTK